MLYSPLKCLSHRYNFPLPRMFLLLRCVDVEAGAGDEAALGDEAEVGQEHDDDDQGVSGPGHGPLDIVPDHPGHVHHNLLRPRHRGVPATF